MTDKKPVQVVATAVGFYGHLRQIGDRFEIPGDEEPGRWMRLTNEDGSIKLTVDEKTGDAPLPVVPQALPQTSFPPFTPAAIVYSVKHVPVGNFVVIDADGNQVGDVFKAVESQKGAAKTSAQQEADRLNAEAAAQSPLSPVQAAVATTEEAESANLPDA
jgi:hypothetical protein